VVQRLHFVDSCAKAIAIDKMNPFCRMLEAATAAIRE
jgi:hypothetical protein